MRPRRRGRGAWLIALLLVTQGLSVPPLPGADSPAPAPVEPKRQMVGKGPGGCALEIAAGPGSILDKDNLILKDYVDIRCGDLRIQADLVHYIPSTHDAHAEGNVVIDQAKTRITADIVDYNIESGTGQFINARGYAEPSILFEAARVEQTGKDEMVLYDANFTACTQPVPYWSFKIGKGILHLGDYAYLHDASFKVGHATVFYSPYLVWPIKSDRASGLLFPEFGVSQRSGTVLSEAWYWAMRRNMDSTYYVDWMSKSGLGTGVEYRYVPGQSGRGIFSGYFIRDEVAKEEGKPGVPYDRWLIDYTHQQDLSSEWRFVVNADFVSDFDYFLDFERDIRLSSNPQAVSKAFLTRNWGFYSLNMWAERREQLVQEAIIPSGYGQPIFAFDEATILRLTAPEVELRSRRQRIGSLPLYYSLESSVDNFDKGDKDAVYQRADAFPLLSSQLSPVPWLDVDANAGVRDTYYTKSQRSDLGCDNLPGTGDFGEGNGIVDGEVDNPPLGVFGPEDDLGCDNLPGTGDFGEGNGVRDFERTVIVDDNFNRRIYQAGLTLRGPKLSRVFNTPGSTFSPQYKNTLEPSLTYTYLSDVANSTNLIQFDDIDTIAGSTNTLTYGLTSRLYARRPVAGADELGTEYVPGASGDRGPQDALARALQKVREDKARDAAANPAGDQTGPDGSSSPSKQLSTVEIASFDIAQDYSFVRPLSVSAALAPIGAPPVTEPFSPVRGTLRINPSINTSVDLRTSYDILFNQIKAASLSANLRNPGRGYLDLTWTIERDLEGKALLDQGRAQIQPFNQNQIGLAGEASLFSRRVLLGFQTNYELGDVQPGEPRLRDQSYRAGYNTQCCGFQMEYLNRNFIGSSIQEFRVLINLKGVGNVVDLHESVGGGY